MLKCGACRIHFERTVVHLDTVHKLVVVWNEATFLIGTDYVSLFTL